MKTYPHAAIIPVLFGKLWVPDSSTHERGADRYTLLTSRARAPASAADAWARWHGLRRMTRFPPVRWASPTAGRASESERTRRPSGATYEVFGLPTSQHCLAKHLIDRFAGPDYGWMWPFRRTVGR